VRTCILVLICCLVVIVGQTHPVFSASPTPEKTQPGSVADGLVGAWRLVSIETIRPNGEAIYPFYGRHPEGLLIYDRSGWMSVQIVSDPKPTVPLDSSREGFLAAPPAEKVAAVNGYYAYFGTWTVDPSASTVTHRIQQSLYPAERGEEGVRHLILQGNRLTLTAKAHEMGEDHERRLVWERISPSSH
jgi:Lipocalin-like domain